jgi:methyltransferase (TIGR00027 family)
MKAGRPSSTARLITRSLVFLSQDPLLAPLVPAGAAEAGAWFIADSAREREGLRRLMGRGWFRSLVWLVERRTVPGMLLHYLLRKRYLEEVARESLGEGYGQVVVLGAGFDTLPLRLCQEHPQARFFEIDHPATQAVKRAVLQERSPAGGNLKLLPLDLDGQDLQESLLASPDFEPGRSTLFIAEGLLMYLAPRDVGKLFRTLRALGGERCRFAFTFMEPQSDGRVRFRNEAAVIGWWLRQRGEPLRWGVPREEMSRFLEEQGFTCREIITPDLFRARYLHSERLRSLPLADGDHPCLAEAC